MSRTLSKATLGLFVLAAIGMVAGRAAQTPGTSGSGTAPSPVDVPTVCLALRNHGACVTCCKEAVQGADIPISACAKFCKNNVPPPPDTSDPEPQP